MEKKDKYEQLKRNIINDAGFTRETLLILMCAMIIASIGLNTNSTAVIIGAMLISPLMSPIQALALGLSTGNLKRIFLSSKKLILFIIISIVSSTFYFLLSPIKDATPQILARTSPTLWDVLIAVFGGIAGVIGKTKEDGGNVVPGVAIATALMPPLCVVGFGIAQGNFAISFGAGYLFAINLFCIMLMTLIGLEIYEIMNKKSVNKMPLKQKLILLIGGIIIIVPSIYSASILVKDSYRENSLKKFIKTEMKNHYVFDSKINKKNKTISLKIVGENVKKQEYTKLEGKLEKYNLKNYKLKIVQLSNEKYLTAQDLSKYLKEENESTKLLNNTKNNEDIIDFENDLKIVENVLYKNFANYISEVKIGKLLNDNNEEKFVVLITGNEKITDEIINQIKKVEFDTDEKYEIFVEKNISEIEEINENKLKNSIENEKNIEKIGN